MRISAEPRVRAIETALSSLMDSQTFFERWHKISAGYSNNTLLVLNRTWRIWARFSQENRMPILPILLSDICGFLEITFQDKKHSTLKLMVFGIDLLYRLADAENPLDTRAGRKALRQFRTRVDNEVLSAKPINAALIEQLLSTMTPGDISDLRDAAWLSVAYEGMLKAGEIVNLKHEHVSYLDGNRLAITVKSNSSEKPEGLLIELSQNTSSRLKAWIDGGRSTDDSLFCRVAREGGMQILKGRLDTYDLRAQLIALVERSGLDPKGYSASGVRIGAAHDLFLSGMSTTVIAELGRWRDINMVVRYTVRLGDRVKHLAVKARPTLDWPHDA